jgi:hypothetical protein
MIKVIFIAGSGRTGSTLLSILMSQNPDCFNLGQIRDIHIGIRDNGICSCGDRFLDCSFWSVVLNKIYGENYVDGVRTDLRYFRQFAGDAVEENVWSNIKEKEQMCSTYKAFLKNLRRKYETCAEVSGKTILVDSSKSPELALALSLIPEIDLYILNLVRHPGAVAVSWLNKTKSISDTAQYCRLWKQRQRQLACLAAVNPEKYKLVYYEKLAAQPVTTLDEINDWVELSQGNLHFNIENEVDLSWEKQHIFPPANESILMNKPEMVRITPSTEWKNLKYIPLRLLASAKTFPDNLYHGYGII